MSKNSKEWITEFGRFLDATGDVPAEVSGPIVGYVRAALTPPFSRVAGKFGAVNVIAAVLTLLVCPQMGFGGYLANFGGHIAHVWGPLACGLFCGSVFLGSGTLAATLLLRPEELRVLRRHGVVSLLSVGALLYGALMVLGASVALLESLGWAAGAAITGGLVLVLVSRWRLSPRALG